MTQPEVFLLTSDKATHLDSFASGTLWPSHYTHHLVPVSVIYSSSLVVDVNHPCVCVILCIALIISGRYQQLIRVPVTV